MARHDPLTALNGLIASGAEAIARLRNLIEHLRKSGGDTRELEAQLAKIIAIQAQHNHQRAELLRSAPTRPKES